jgi:hypothetical protein
MELMELINQGQFDNVFPNFTVELQDQFSLSNSFREEFTKVASFRGLDEAEITRDIDLVWEKHDVPGRIDHWSALCRTSEGAKQIPVSRDGKCWIRAPLVAIQGSLHSSRSYDYDGRVALSDGVTSSAFVHPDQVSELNAEISYVLVELEYLRNHVNDEDLGHLISWNFEELETKCSSSTQAMVTLGQARTHFENLFIVSRGRANGCMTRSSNRSDVRHQQEARDRKLLDAAFSPLKLSCFEDAVKRK